MQPPAPPLTAQVKMGANPSTIQPSALLELESTGKGFLPPRMTYLQMVAIPAPADYLLVACTDCTAPGLYNYVAPSWLSVMGNTVSPVLISFNTFLCGGALAGNYQESVPTTAANTKTVSFTAGGVGSYAITTNSANGIVFSGAANVTSVGPVNAVLTASGTPYSPGTYSYTVTVGTNTCTFQVTYLPQLNFLCNNVTITQNPGGPLLNNTPYTGTYVTPYSSGNGSAYPAFSQTINGLTLTAPSGTYASAGGSVTYTLSGTYNSASFDTVTFSTPGCGNGTFGDAMRNALASAGCASCAAYEAAYENDWVQVTAAEYAAVGSVLNVSGVAYRIIQPANIGGVTGSNPAGLCATVPDVQIPALSYIIGFSTITGNSAGITTGAELRLSGGNSAITSNYSAYGNPLPSLIFLGSTRYYYVLKFPFYISSLTGLTYLGVYTGSNGNFCGAVPTATTKSYFTAGGTFTSAPTTPQNFKYNHQVITTTQRQW